MFKYFTKQRPPSPGAVPKDGIVIGNSYDGRKEVEGIGPCWGHVIYKRRLTPKEISDYELAELNQQAEESAEWEAGKRFSITRVVNGTELELELTDAEIEAAFRLQKRRYAALDVVDLLGAGETRGYSKDHFDDCLFTADEVIESEDARLEIADIMAEDDDADVSYWANLEAAVRVFVEKYNR